MKNWITKFGDVNNEALEHSLIIFNISGYNWYFRKYIDNWFNCLFKIIIIRRLYLCDEGFIIQVNLAVLFLCNYVL